MSHTAGPASPLLRVRGLTKTFATTEPPTQVLHGIDLDVEPGEFLAIMGSSGSGKSTLLYSMSGMDTPTGGTVELEGRELTSLSDAEMSRVRLTRMGFVFQQAHFLANLSIRDNVLLPALKAAAKGDDSAERRVDDLLGRFGLSHVADNGITQVSGGQLQRASLCRALATEPAVLFADEPTGALNSSMTQEVLDALSEVHRGGTTVVMVTHDPACAARADRLVYLLDGRLVDEIRLGEWEREHSDRREAELADWLKALGF
ncbi:ABC transporter ATP-binding protein [Tessaracoccus caeni]|uniref:ABC transporter ATP-binding protein n=1 Tax=Tessaracoccus caeni TaxID=3031239 RepID=UPI0023DB4D9D|nr:ABC transporter ATP-binding protein [Tessaracoccus caeni]MDF1489720.1 ABC transporter ATP-binding protein [Tessaracoccus caeni]